MKNAKFLLLIFLLLVPMLVIGQTRPRPMAIFSDAPQFSLPDLEGNIVNHSDFKGKKDVLVVFFRGWLEDHF